MDARRRVRVTCLALYLLAQTLFVVRVAQPSSYVFDEFHYVPAAKAYLSLTNNRNWEHPPLGKYFIGAGIALLGDEALGWRFFSTVFGALIVVGMYLWALAIFREPRLAVWVALITLVDQYLYVMARIAMLDVFMVCFMVWGLAAFSAAWESGRDAASTRRLLRFAGAMFGLATAVKWEGLAAWGSCWLLLVGVRVLRGTGAVPQTPVPAAADEPWHAADLWQRVGGRYLVLAFGLLPLALYCVTFLPFLALKWGPDNTLLGILRLQRAILLGHLHVSGVHIYESPWYTWALGLRPQWFAWATDPDNPVYVRAILLLGNPLVMWAGFAAAFVSLWNWVRRGTRDALLVTAWYWGLYLAWAVVPRPLTFYHYYFAAAMALGLNLAYVFRRYERGRLFPVVWARWVFLAAAAVVFVIFFPVLAALRMPGGWFPK
ncbi:MAG TPA: phospholipid carrier-dependent glycosyltransferase [Terriglobales bacterium]|nr:phospholipid carrier-dependent glycosyltransferase [Terriglobales bacterium]